MSSPSAQDRLEDTLTDGVFSALRYLPRNVLARWLRSVLPTPQGQAVTDAAVESAVFEFWPTLPGGSEPDVVITVGSLLVVVEAKYQSGFGQNAGRHQLAVEWDHSRREAQRRALDGPVVVAITAHLVEPPDIEAVRGQLPPDELSAAGLASEDAIVWCPWQAVAKSIDAVDRSTWTVGERAVADDVFDLMTSRGVRYVYEGFKTADWWLLAAAADAATERVYPAVAEFGNELRAHGAKRELIWGGTDSGVVWYESKHPSNTHRWHRHYIQLPMLHTGFGRRLKNYCALYVLFTFNDPAIRAGWWFQLNTAEAVVGRSAGIVDWLQQVDPTFDVIDTTPWDRQPMPVDRSRITSNWLQDRLNKGWYRIERSWPPDAVNTTAPIIDLLADLGESLIDNGAVLDALEADGTLDRSQAAAVTSIAASAQPDDARAATGEVATASTALEPDEGPTA